jgi:hypothetical protein
MQAQLKDRIRQAGLRSNRAMLLVDFALARPIFTTKQVQHHFSISYQGANNLIAQLEKVGVLTLHGTPEPVHPGWGTTEGGGGLGRQVSPCSPWRGPFKAENWSQAHYQPYVHLFSG